MIKAEELKGKSADELKKMIMDKRKEQFNLRFQLSGGQLEDASKMRKIRRDIARIKTAMNQQSKAA